MRTIRHYILTFLLLVTFNALVARAPTRNSDHLDPCMPCMELSALRLPEVRIDSAEEVEGGKQGTVYCRVLGVIGKEIGFESLVHKGVFTLRCVLIIAGHSIRAGTRNPPS